MIEIASLFWTQIWQVTAVAAMVFGVVKFAAKDKPHLAHMLWALVLIKCITPPIFSSHISPFSWMSADAITTNVVQPIDTDLTAEIETVVESGKVTIDAPGLNLWQIDREAHRSVVSIAPNLRVSDKPVAVNWKQFVIGGWLFGSAICLFWQACRFMQLKLQTKRTELQPSPEIEALVSSLSARLGLKGKVKTLITSTSIGPAVVGLFRPKILLPAAIVNRRPIDELEPLIAHELIHIRRGDLWWAILQTTAGSLFWFHPLVRFAVTGISRESERSCDEETVASLECRPADYARCLLNVLEQKHRLRSAPALPGVKPIEITSARLERVMKLGHGSHKRTPWWTWAVLIACCAIVLPGAALVIAQETGDKTEAISNPLTSTTQAKPIDSTLEEKIYPVDDIIDEMVKKQPEAEIQELELRLLKHFKGYPSPADLNSGDPKPTQTVTRIRNGKLSATRTAVGHGKLRDRLKNIRKYGLRQIVITTQVIRCPSATFDDLKWEKSLGDSCVSKKGVVHRKIAMGGPIPAASFEAKDPMLNPDVLHTAKFINESEFDGDDKYELHDAETASRGVFKAILTQGETWDLLRRVATDENSLVTQAPTATVFDGHKASIRDHAHVPFVTGVDEIRGEDQVAHSPHISLLSDGTVVNVLAESASATEIELEVDVMYSKIIDVQVFTFPGSTPDSGVSIQLPELAASQLQFSGIVGQDESLVVRTTNPEDEQEELLFVMSPKLVEESAIVVSKIRKKSAKQPVSYCLSNDVPPALVECPVRPMGSGTRSGSSLSEEQYFQKVCFENKVNVSKDEIDLCIENRAALLGIFPQRWIELISTARDLNEKQVRELVSTELRFRKLPEDIQRKVDKGQLGIRANANLDGMVIRAKDGKRNWKIGEAKILETGGQRFVVRTDVEISATRGGIEFSGNDLEVVTASGEAFASADKSRFVVEGGIALIQLKGHAQLNLGDGGVVNADSIRYEMESESEHLNFEGNASLVSEALSGTADRIEFINEKMIFTGNAKLTIKSEHRHQFKANRIKFSENGEVLVDDVKQMDLDD